MLAEKKYIIAKVDGHYKHLRFPTSMYHDTFARDNGFDVFSQVVETGMLVDGKIHILTCKDERHRERRDYTTRLPDNVYKARAAQTMYMYKIKLDGD